MNRLFSEKTDSLSKKLWAKKAHIEIRNAFDEWTHGGFDSPLRRGRVLALQAFCEAIEVSLGCPGGPYGAGDLSGSGSTDPELLGLKEWFPPKYLRRGRNSGLWWPLNNFIKTWWSSLHGIHIESSTGCIVARYNGLDVIRAQVGHLNWVRFIVAADKVGYDWRPMVRDDHWFRFLRDITVVQESEVAEESVNWRARRVFVARKGVRNEV